VLELDERRIVRCRPSKCWLIYLGNLKHSGSLSRRKALPNTADYMEWPPATETLNSSCLTTTTTTAALRRAVRLDEREQMTSRDGPVFRDTIVFHQMTWPHLNLLSPNRARRNASAKGPRPLYCRLVNYQSIEFTSYRRTRQSSSWPKFLTTCLSPRALPATLTRAQTGSCEKLLMRAGDSIAVESRCLSPAVLNSTRVVRCTVSLKRS
jgi:hypothetical protein